MYHSGTLVVHYEMYKTALAIKQPTESFNHYVPYDKKTVIVTLHIAKDIMPVTTVEKPEVHPHTEKVRPKV